MNKQTVRIFIFSVLMPLAFQPGVCAEEAPFHPIETGTHFLEERLPYVRNIGGFFKTRHYLRFNSLGELPRSISPRGKRLEDVYEFRNDLRLETDVRINPNISGKVSTDLQLHYGVDRNEFRTEEERFKLWEGYGEVEYESFNVRLGRQVIRWGKADSVNPIDNFTPENYKEYINLDRADRKLPVLGTYAKWFFHEVLHWEGIWIPFFQENLIAESEQDWEFFFRRNYRKELGLTPLPEARRGRSFDNGVWATRFVYQGERLDASLSYAYHFEQNPSYSVFLNPLFPALSADPGTVRTVWNREHSVGMDFEFVYKGWGFRGENVFVTNKPYVTFDTGDADLIERKHTFQSVLGADYTFNTDTYINLQYTQDFIFEYDEGMEPRRYEPSITWRLSQKFLHDKLKLEFTGRYYLADTDFYYKTHFIYELTENTELDFGAMFFEGEALGIFGQFDDNDQLFLHLNHYF